MSGYFTGGVMPQVTAPTGSEQIPCDTETASGVAPQSGYLTAAQLGLGANGTASATAGAATLNAPKGVITSESITTAAAADYVLTLTNSSITAASIVLASAANGTNTTEGLAINRVQPSAGQVIIRVRNTNAASALNGTIVVSFKVF